MRYCRPLFPSNAVNYPISGGFRYGATVKKVEINTALDIQLIYNLLTKYLNI